MGQNRPDAVQRTFWLLQDLGAIHSLPSRNRLRFDGRNNPHLECRKRGRLPDFGNPECDRFGIARPLNETGIVENAQAEVRGTCRSCALKSGSRGRPAVQKEKSLSMAGSRNAGK